MEMTERGVAKAVKLFVDEDMTEGALIEAPPGRVAVYSSRSPAKPPPNEDAAAILPYRDSECALVVADGLGGARAGHQASRLAVEALESALGRGANRGIDLREAIMNGFEEANRAVLDLGIGAATTLAAVEVRGPIIRPYHAGDTLILVVGQRGKLKMQSVPHSPVGYGIESGLLDEKEAMYHKERHIVSNVIGAPDMMIEVGPALKLAARDTLLIASDGLWDNLHTGEIIDVVRKGSLQRAARVVAARCDERMRRGGNGSPSKPDDLTFIVYRMSRQSRVSPEATINERNHLWQTQQKP